MADKSLNGAKLEKIPIHFQLGDNLIDGAVVRPLTFQGFVDCIIEAQAMKQPTSFDARMRRVRMIRQVAYHINGTVVPMSMEDVLKLPIPDTRKISAKLDDNEGKAGKIIRDGDGIDQAITYELGTPIPVGAGKEPIRELEFHASTYGDIEDVMAADNPMAQTAKLIETVAKPLGSTLMQLPSWAINQISVADGITISKDILPRFLGSPDE
ncbi:hypothetical protein CQ14_06845 [Bradyrhizobium lablabi]|uniref:Uncharacterized protein n=1 Tax=Bradyrhizobium lablabi TaxID=722472 RepID=A0A0R3MN46_9BRAD|nr:hypothetical protein [Bradyrhizobium lablabi]KRR21361.1 hypothetical protein CQ14_06845 [Bradyrhizobium lablabi]